MTLNRRVLNRTTLDRQLLLARSAMTPAQAVGRLVALQGQDVNPPYFGLWSRLESFTQDDLTTLLQGRQVVRGTLLRATQHLALAEDYLWLRPLLQPRLSRGLRGAFGGALREVDLDELAGLARAHLTGRTLTRTQVRDLLAERWPDVDRLALNWTVQAVIPVIHTPPSGVWNRGGAVPFTLAEEWLGRPLDAAPPIERLVTRYLAAFGPASVMDVQTWSGLTRLRPVIEAMGLRAYRDDDGRVLYDLPDAPLADADAPAPVRFLPYFDNLIVAYADRSRLMTAEQRKVVSVGSVVYPTFLVDGVVAGMWDLKDGVLRLRPFRPLPGTVMAELAAEGERLLAFAGEKEAEIAVDLIQT
ncbi:winged helix DNA-binding domain-containing protein [Nonomuraea sp. SBT364]|uniref:winged helix DNA-binding domain-containing protein n=1 Tax=Nonomuraea sp. SBT364 TaxID=1580530 RepID=UPI00066E7B1F|nr:winged helix DNA-binding domain-containing protein [Nonomuraea sp. SBT364]